MEGCVECLQTTERDQHIFHGGSEHEVDAAAAIHEDAAHVKASDLRLEYERTVSSTSYLRRVVAFIEGDA